MCCAVVNTEVKIWCIWWCSSHDWLWGSHVGVSGGLVGAVSGLGLGAGLLAPPLPLCVDPEPVLLVVSIPSPFRAMTVNV